MKLSTRDSSHDPMAPVELKRLIEESFALSELRIKSLGIQITISESCKTNDLILCREGQIVQVMINLINNSLDAIQPQTSPWIKVDTKISKPGFIDILIVDSGHGIPDHVRHKIFEPFYTTKEVGKGTGLGLSISRKYILDNQGDFFVDTENPNTCFVIRLPLV